MGIKVRTSKTVEPREVSHFQRVAGKHGTSRWKGTEGRVYQVREFRIYLQNTGKPLKRVNEGVIRVLESSFRLLQGERMEKKQHWKLGNQLRGSCGKMRVL